MAAPIREQPARKAGGLPCLGWAILALTAVMAAFWSHAKLLNQDEIFSLQTDRVATLAEVLRIQHDYPISLEAPPYHILSHAAMQLFGPTAFALRLPSLLGFLLLEACLFFFVRSFFLDRQEGKRAGLVAMAIPALSAVLFYAAEGRPYGLLLGAYALTALMWQTAARRGEAAQPRTWPLIGLVFALALTLNAHFYGILALIPICGAELARTITRRKLDWPMLTAIAAGLASFALTVPYIKASAEFKKHYYTGVISPHMITQPYRQMLIDYTKYPHAVQTVLALALVLAAALVVWGCIRAVRDGDVNVRVGEATLLALLALLPVFAFILGRAVTHALEPRHSFGAIVAVASLIAIAAGSLLKNTRTFYAVIAAMLAGIVLINTARTRESAREGRAQLATLTLTPAQRADADALADTNVYFQDVGQWELASQYTPDPALRSRLVLVYSLDEEMRRRHHDTHYLTAVHSQRFTNLPIASYDQLRQRGGLHIFAAFHSGWSWTDDAFRDEAAQITPLGPAFGGDLVLVRFP